MRLLATALLAATMLSALPAIAQDATSGQVLTLAWMNRNALEASIREGRAVYWSRSRSRLWR